MAARDHAFAVFSEHVGKKMQVVRAPRNGRAQIIRRNVPVRDAIERLEQRSIEHPHRLWVGEVDAFLAVRVEDHERGQFRTGFDQLRKIVMPLMTIARVQGGFFAWRCWLGRSLRLLARRFRGIGHGFDFGCE